MSKRIVSFTLATFTLTAAAAAQDATCAWTGFTPRNVFERGADFAADPVHEIRAHLARVVGALEASDVAHLTAEQRANRASHIARLVEYAAAGEFPQNDVLPFPTPIFIDSGARACAVGHLMSTSDGRDLALRIATEQNTAYLPDIRTAGVEAWIESSGLTAEECALIQPAYSPCGFVGSPPYFISCSPSTFSSAVTTVCGTNVASQNFMSLVVEFLPLGTTGYFLNSREFGFTPNPGGSLGALCLGGAIGRHTRDTFHAATTTSATVQLDLTALPTPAGSAAVMAGDTWHFQAWYRVSTPAGPSSDFSNAVSVTFV